MMFMEMSILLRDGCFKMALGKKGDVFLDVLFNVIVG